MGQALNKSLYPIFFSKKSILDLMVVGSNFICLEVLAKDPSSTALIKIVILSSHFILVLKSLILLFINSPCCFWILFYDSSICKIIHEIQIILSIILFISKNKKNTLKVSMREIGFYTMA